MPQAAREGREPEQAMDTRRVDLWLPNTQTKMRDSFNASFDGDAATEG